MIVHQFLAFISKLDDERFIRAEELPPIISRLQDVCRVRVMFQIALEDARGSETDQALSWLSYVSSEEITPFVELCEVYGLATNITNSKGALPEIVWDTSCPDGTQLFVQGLTVSVKSLSELLKSILEQAERILYNGILMGSRDAKRSIDSRIEALKLSLLEGKFLDDLRCERQGYYFGDDIRNRGIFADLSECFLRNILLHRNRRQDFFNVEWEDDKKTVSWSTRRLMVFLELCEKLIEILIPIFQIMSGQPARCTELATTQIRNDDTSRRTLMLVNRRVVNILSYSKTRSITGRPRLVPRFLDSRASSLLLVYLTVVRPVETFFVRRLLGDERANGHAAYLFSTVNGRMGGKEIARSFEKVMRSTWLPLTSRMYRHVCTAFTRELLKGKSLRNQVWLPYDEQAAHTAETAEFRYGRSISDHRCVTSHELVAYHAASVSWQKLLGFSTDESLSISEYRRENLGEIQEGAQLKASSREAFHSSMVIERALQRVDEGLLSLQRDMQFLKESDGVFKKSRQIESAEGDDRSDPTRFGSSELQRPQKPDTRAVDARKYAVKTVRSFSRGISVPSSDWSQSPTLERTLLYRKYLQDMLNDVNAEFKSREQLLAIHEAHSRDRDVLAVLPTGGGKSMLFLVPSALEKDLITVVVCPLVALSNDMKNRFARFGIRFAAWSERHNDDFQILIVSIETASTNDFLDFLNQLALRSVLARIVIDEAHIILTSAEYRPKLKELISMRPSAPVPLLLLTASLPPSMTQELCRAVGSRNTLIIRSPSTIRSNIKYSIRQGSKIGTTARFRTIVAILKHHIAQFGNDDRAIIYCHTKFATEILAKNLSDEGRELKARPYHSESCQKELLDKSWRFGLARVMVATGAFGAGIDYPHVRLVIHDGNPRTILDFAQESGRAGRDGRKAESIVLLQPPSTSLHARGRRSIGPMTEEEDPRVRKWIAECTRGSCIRQSLHMHLDGCAVPCIGQPKGEVQLCAACEKAVRKNKRAFDESLNEEYLNTKCRKMSISSSLALESARADAERRKITEALRKFNEVCALLKQRECPHCMGANAARCNTPSLLHSQGRCPYLRQRCLRCYSTSHSSSSQCPSPPFSFPERGGKCYQCGFRKEYFGVTIHEKDRFGRQCSSNAKFAREVLLSMWVYQKRLLAKEISEFELLSGDIMKYQGWLYDVQSAPPNIVILFNKLYACESKSEVPQ